jgi:prefoldin subunit 5
MDSLKWSIDQIKSKSKKCDFEIQILESEIKKLQEFITKIAKTEANLDNTNWLSLVTLSAQAKAISNEWELS